MRYPRFVRLSALIVAVVLVAVGCSDSSGDGDDAATDKGRIGIALPTTVSARWLIDGDNLVYEFGKMGYTTDLEYADDDQAKQIAQLEAMISSGARALIVGAVSSTGLTAVLAKAAAAKMTVIAYDRLIRETADVDYYATFDNTRVGVLQGTYLAEALGLKAGGGPYTIELFAGSADDNNSQMFFDGAMSVLRPYISDGTLVVRSGQTSFEEVTTAGWSSAVARQRMTRILDEYYGSARLNAVLSPNDDLTRGILTAVKAAGYRGATLPKLTGQDAELESVRLIAAGEQGHTVFKDTRKLAQAASQMTDAALTGGEPQINDTAQFNNGVKVVPTYLLQPVSVDKSNYESVLVGSGYYSADQVGS
ncbi:sugar-binding protein [Cryptosporangium aurantiacum]|uniref:Putative multiple sugar transport system substrate-binding protein n=1 Tax=Cryptosporangium aurantiacum TaxID=134849 RepID=A0A1M7RN62_9ACTN|nr:sugar-binding protein [Cryptosporangium aurantiacum]SHN47743.1 putative multiple sugar transport system substrate-binding protein [Cryptosporangium aurantiacum]